MDLNISDISSSGLMAIIVLVTTVAGFIRGMVRMTFAFIAILIGSVGAYWGFVRGGSMLNGYFVDPPSWLPAAAGLVLGISFFVTARIILGMMLKPIKVVDGRRRNLPIPGAIVGVLTGAVVAYIAVGSVRYLGTVAEIDRLDRAVGKKEIEKDVPVSPFITLKNFIDESKPGQLHAKLDFINDRSRTQLAKLKILAQEQHAINLSAGGNQSVYAAFSQSDIQKLLATTPDIEIAFLREKRWAHLLDSERLRKVAEIPAARKVLELAEIEESIGIVPEPLFPKPPEPKEKATAKK